VGQEALTSGDELDALPFGLLFSGHARPRIGANWFDACRPPLNRYTAVWMIVCRDARLVSPLHRIALTWVAQTCQVRFAALAEASTTGPIGPGVVRFSDSMTRELQVKQMTHVDVAVGCGNATSKSVPPMSTRSGAVGLASSVSCLGRESSRLALVEGAVSGGNASPCLPIKSEVGGYPDAVSELVMSAGFANQLRILQDGDCRRP